MVEARKALTEARGNYYEAIYGHALSRLNLQKAMGVLAPDRNFRRTSEVGDLPAQPARISEFEK